MEDTITCEQAEVRAAPPHKWARYGELFAYDSTATSISSKNKVHPEG